MNLTISASYFPSNGVSISYLIFMCHYYMETELKKNRLQQLFQNEYHILQGSYFGKVW